MRNSILTQITALAMSLGGVFGGSIMTEIIFGYPGVGSLIQAAILQSDYNMILGCITISIVAIASATLIVDLIYPFIDPRIRYGLIRGRDRHEEILENSQFSFKSRLDFYLLFLIIGFVVYFIPHTNPFTYNTYPNNLGVSAEHWLGTTSMGQDIVWLLIEAIHNSLMIGLIVATIGTVVGVLVGLLAGFAGGALDRVLMIITDTFVVIPSLPILIMMTSLMKGSSTVIVMALVLAMFAWHGQAVRSVPWL